jgi:superfamily II DNA or RNA helicase
MKIVVGNIFCSVADFTEQNQIRDSCRYKKEIYKPGAFAKTKSIVEGSMVVNKKFLTGLLPRVLVYCNNKQIKIEKDQKNNKSPTIASAPNLRGIEFRPDQKEAINKACTISRGVIKAPTGSGKTVIAGGICSMLPTSRILFMCHTLDLLTQTYDEFIAWGLKNVVMVGGGSAIYRDEIEDQCIVVATIQSIHNMDHSYFKNFDMVIIDEAHHVTVGSSYTKFLEKIDAPIRIGLTATPPQKGSHAELVTEGYLGPIIAELTIEKGMEMGIIAKPVIDLIPVPYISRISELKTYREIYREGVINNKVRNNLILQYTFDEVDNGKSVLILTGKETDHGKILQQMARDIYQEDIVFLYGSTSKEDRTDFKEQLKSRKLKCAIANIIWYEGINIPPIDIIINAEGGKASGKTLQKAGRGLRTSEGKTHLVVVDFLDPYKYLSHHCVLRLITYAEQGWLKPNF